MVSDDPIGPTVTGYSMIKAGSMDGVVEMAKGCPVKLSGASISILEVKWPGGRIEARIA